jgi:diguanylate cyclase (GGDEF)-like protein
VLHALLWLSLATIAWFLYWPAGVHLRVQVLWMLQVPLDVALCVLALRVRSAAVAVPARQFWSVLAAAGALFAVGDLWHSIAIIHTPRTEAVAGGTVQTLAFLAGLGGVVAMMLRYPVAVAGPGRERQRYFLDAATVLVGGALLAWCFAVDPATASGDLIAILVGTGVVLVAAFAAVKMVLTGSAPMTIAAAAPMIAAAFLQGIVVFITPTAAGAPIPAWVMLLRLSPSVLMAVGPRIQQLQARHDPGSFAPKQRKGYSLLPYLAVTVTFVALISTVPDGADTRRLGVVAGTMAIIGLVVARQLLAFHDNATLISRLDTALVELREHEKLLREQASYDALTRLANRAALAERVAAALAPDRRDQPALLLVDLDDFKAVNDTLGHGVGDQVLVSISERLCSVVRTGDMVARLGGDEFAILLHRAPGDGAGQTAQRILESLVRPVTAGGHDLLIRASIGLAHAGEGDDLDSLLRHADIAMYAAKDRGKGGWTAYSPEMGTRILETVRLGAELREAVDADEFELLYQPIVRLPDGQMVGNEALIRWRHPTRGLVSPGDFIPVAESTGLIVPLGRWVMRQACRQTALWRAEFADRAPAGVSVNVAGRQLQEPGFVADVATALADSGLPAGCLTIEVTETALLGDGGAIQTLHALRGLGVNLALDDFGTAASSLGLLLTCPVTSLKLDRSFVERVTTVNRQAAVATAVVQMAQALDLTAVAEGVESPAQAQRLHQLGYRLAQGFLFSPPLTPDEIVARWLRPAAHRRTRGARQPVPRPRQGDGGAARRRRDGPARGPLRPVLGRGRHGDADPGCREHGGTAGRGPDPRGDPGAGPDEDP